MGVQLQAVTPAEPATVPPPPVAQENDSGNSPATGGESNPAQANQPAEPAADANPYQAIIIRNAFGLTDPPPPPPPPQQTNPPVNVGALKITGLTTLMGKRAMFVLEEGRTNILSDLLREGERDRSITNLEVLEIDEKARAVRVNYGGVELKLDFVNNGIHPPTNMVLAGGPPGLGRPGLPVPAMASIQTANSAPAGFTRPVIQAGSTGFRGGTRSLPMRPTRLANQAAGGVSQHSSSEPVLSAEQQRIIMQEQQRVAAQQGIQLPPPPPVPGAVGGGPPALPGQ